MACPRKRLGNYCNSIVSKLIETEIIRGHFLIEHHKLSSQNSGRLLPKVAVRQVEAPVLCFGNYMRAELLKLILVLGNAQVAALGFVKINQVLFSESCELPFEVVHVFICHSSRWQVLIQIKLLIFELLLF